MPIAEIHIIEGRSDEKKEELIARMTGVLCEVLEVKPQQVRIIIDEMKVNNFGIAGESVAKRRASK